MAEISADQGPEIPTEIATAVGDILLGMLGWTQHPDRNQLRTKLAVHLIAELWKRDLQIVGLAPLPKPVVDRLTKQVEEILKKANEP
jgi:hypothetical protein